MARIYYDDGSVVETDGKQPIPARGVQIVVQEHPDIGWHTQSGSDYYVWRNGRYQGVDIFGLFDWLLDRGDVLFGRTMTTKTYNEVMAQAMKDLKGFKVGWLRDERKPQ